MAAQQRRRNNWDMGASSFERSLNFHSTSNTEIIVPEDNNRSESAKKNGV
jgi:hypothetical protein